MSPLRPAEDTAAQEGAVVLARGGLAGALDDLARAAGDGGDVAAEARALARSLRSRAKRPPAVDLGPLWGAVSAVERVTTTTLRWDEATRAARDAEQLHDLALHDLATARGEDA